MRARWGEVPFAALAVCLGIGITLSRLIDDYCFCALAVAAGALIAASCAALMRNRPAISASCALCAIVIGGVLLALAERDAFPPTDVRSLLAHSALSTGKPALLDGCVLEDSSRRGPDFVTTVQLHGLRRNDAWIKATGTVQFRMAAPENAAAGDGALKYGDRIRAWAECDVPRNFQNPGSTDRVAIMARRGIHLLARIKSPRLMEILPQDFGTPWGRTIASVRRSLRAQFQRLRNEGNSQQAAVLASVVLGDYGDLSGETRTRFQNAGTYHVLVVSGLHVSAIAWALIQLMRLMRLPLAAARMLTVTGLLFFTSLVGFQASITRALWMFTLYVLGQGLFRNTSAANTVFACSFLLLAAHPGWLWDPGFQLSFLSVAAIVLMGAPIIENSLRPLVDPLRYAGSQERRFLQPGTLNAVGRRAGVRIELFCEACADRFGPAVEAITLLGFRTLARAAYTIGSMILISISVQIWLEPTLAFYFNRLSWIAPVSNLAVVPISSLVLALGMAAEISVLVTSLAWPLFRVAGISADLLMTVNRWFADLPAPGSDARRHREFR